MDGLDELHLAGDGGLVMGAFAWGGTVEVAHDVDDVGAGVDGGEKQLLARLVRLVLLHGVVAVEVEHDGHDAGGGDDGAEGVDVAEFGTELGEVDGDAVGAVVVGLSDLGDELAGGCAGHDGGDHGAAADAVNEFSHGAAFLLWVVRVVF